MENCFKLARDTTHNTGYASKCQGVWVLMEEVAKAWLAGLVDGEGTITIARNKMKGRNKDLFRPILCITNSSLELLQCCKTTTDLGEIYKQKKQTSHHRQVYRWRVSDGKAVSIVIEIKPYLIAKRRQAEIVCNLSELKGDRGEEAYKTRTSLWEEAKRANHSLTDYQKLPHTSKSEGGVQGRNASRGRARHIMAIKRF